MADLSSALFGGDWRLGGAQKYRLRALFELAGSSEHAKDVFVRGFGVIVEAWNGPLVAMGEQLADQH